MTRPGERSRRAFALAQKYLPGGVNSPVRAFRAVGGEPPIIAYGRGSPPVDGDAPGAPPPRRPPPPGGGGGARRPAGRATSCGPPRGGERERPRLICEAMPSVE